MQDLSTCPTCGSAVEELNYHAMYCGLTFSQARASDAAYARLRDLSGIAPRTCSAIGTEPVTVHGLGANGTIFTGDFSYVLPELHGTFRAIASPYCAGDHRSRAAALQALRTFKAPR